MTQLEKDIDALVGRFARDLVALLRRAPVSDVSHVLRVTGAPRSRGSAKAWSERYGLTDAQTAILAAVVAGRTRAQIASSRGTSIETIKRQVHDLLRKTGTARSSRRAHDYCASGGERRALAHLTLARASSSERKYRDRGGLMLAWRPRSISRVSTSGSTWLRATRT